MKKCKICGNSDFQIIANKICQKCFSANIELKLKEKGIKLIISSSDLIYKYLIQKVSVNALAKELNCTSFNVRSLLDLYRITIRSNKEALSNVFDESVFSNLSAQGAFLLGYIYTDGDLLYNEITKKYFLRIYSKHKEQIENIKAILKTNAKIQHREQKNYGNIIQGEIYFIHIANDAIISDIMALGLTLYKNEDVKFPKLPKNLIHHFIRGCWAGSGNVIEQNNGVHSSITIGSYEFIKEIENFLFKNGLSRRTIYKLKSNKSSYKIRYANKESEKLYNLLYSGKTNLTISSKQEVIYKKYFIRKDCNQH